MSEEQIEALVARIHADEKQLEQIKDRSCYRMWAKELRQQIRGNRAILRQLTGEDEA